MKSPGGNGVGTFGYSEMGGSQAQGPALCPPCLCGEWNILRGNHVHCPHCKQTTSIQLPLRRKEAALRRDREKERSRSPPRRRPSGAAAPGDKGAGREGRYPPPGPLSEERAWGALILFSNSPRVPLSETAGAEAPGLGGVGGPGAPGEQKAGLRLSGGAGVGVGCSRRPWEPSGRRGETRPGHSQASRLSRNGEEALLGQLPAIQPGAGPGEGSLRENKRAREGQGGGSGSSDAPKGPR